MRNSRYRYTRLVMVINAFLVAGSGLGLLIVPQLTVDLLGLPTGDLANWASRFLGLILFALGTAIFAISRGATDPYLRSMALIMTLVSASVASSCYYAPGTVSPVRWSVIGLAGLWALLYLITLPIKTVGITEDDEED